MRVALLTNFIPPYRVPLYQAMMRAAGELRVFVSTNMEANRNWTPNNGALDVVRQRTLTFQRQWRTAEFSEPHELHVPYDTWFQLKRWRPDVVLTGELGARSLQAVTFGLRARIPVVIWAMLSDHLENGRGRVRTAARKWLARNAASIIVNGESGARYFHRLGTNDRHLHRVHQTVDMRGLMALPLARSGDEEIRLLHVGSISRRKGVHVLFGGVCRWAESNPRRRVKLTLVGDGPLRSTFERTSVPVNLSVEWVGSIAYDMLPLWYGNGGVLLFPSFGDEWGLVVNEALAAGVPVAGSSYSQAVEELIRDGRNGWVFVPDGEASVAAVVDRIAATDSEQLYEMRVHARETVRHLTPENTAERIVTLLREAAGG